MLYYLRNVVFYILIFNKGVIMLNFLKVLYFKFCYRLSCPSTEVAYFDDVRLAISTSQDKI